MTVPVSEDKGSGLVAVTGVFLGQGAASVLPYGTAPAMRDDVAPSAGGFATPGQVAETQGWAGPHAWSG
jgi:hypothetical protein